ncbi:MAG: NAD(P)-binding protein [Chloroflexota bacterium]
MSAKKQVAIIGAGHNALVCACYLAKAGHDVTVLTAAPTGGRRCQYRGDVVGAVRGSQGQWRQLQT